MELDNYAAMDTSAAVTKDPKIIVVVSLIEGFNRYVDEKIANIGTNAFAVQKFSIEDFSSIQAYEDARRHNKDITLEDLAVLRNRGGVIKDAGAREQEACELKRGTDNLFGVMLVGQTANFIDIENKEVAEGRPFTVAEEETFRMVCFIGADIAERFFPTESAVGKSIKIDGRPFEIIGVAKAQGTVFGQSRDKFATIPLSTFLSIYGSRRSLQINVVSTTADTYLDAIDEAKVVMRTRRKLKPSEKDNFGIITPSAINNLREQILRNDSNGGRWRDVDCARSWRNRDHEHHARLSYRTHQGDWHPQEPRCAATRYPFAVSRRIDRACSVWRCDWRGYRLCAWQTRCDANADPYVAPYACRCSGIGGFRNNRPDSRRVSGVESG